MYDHIRNVHKHYTKTGVYISYPLCARPDFRKYLIKDCHTGKGKINAEIYCPHDDAPSIKLGLAVRWALKNKRSLRRTDLSGGDFSDLDLRGIDLSKSDLSGARMVCADLRGANLVDANLCGTNLMWAKTEGTYFGCDGAGEEVTVTLPIITMVGVPGFERPITIFDNHIRIGGIINSIHWWESLLPPEVKKYGFSSFANAWPIYKDIIISLAHTHRNIEE